MKFLSKYIYVKDAVIRFKQPDHSFFSVNVINYLFQLLVVLVPYHGLVIFFRDWLKIDYNLAFSMACLFGFMICLVLYIKRCDFLSYKPHMCLSSFSAFLKWIFFFFCFSFVLFLTFLLLVVVLRLDIHDYVQTDNSFIFFLKTGILVPVVEEFIFRVHLYNSFKRTSKWYTSMFFSSLFFGLYHNSIIYLFLATLLGCFFVFCNELTGINFFSMIFHVIYNVLTFTFLNFVRVDHLLTFLSDSVLFVALVCLIVFFYVIVFLYLFKKTKDSFIHVRYRDWD